MMYSNKLAMAVKNNGKVLRESGDTIYVPFGSEYSLFIKNMNSLRCLVNIEIDGQDIADGTSFIVPANGSIDIERFLKSGNRDKGNKFKFIERTAGVENHRGGIQVEDGLIRVSFEFEREQQKIVNYVHEWFPSPYWYPHYPHYYGTLGGGVARGAAGGFDGDTYGVLMNSTNTAISKPTGTAAQNSISASAAPSGQSFVNQASFADETPRTKSGNLKRSASKNEAGITAPGSISDQKFTQGSWFPTDGVKHVMILKLLGEHGGQPVQEVVTVKQKQKCTSCGKVNKANAKFCSHCGTSLEVV